MAVASTTIRLADAVKVFLNTNADALGVPFTAVREYIPRYSIGETSALKVTVVPQATTSEQVTRGGTYSHDYIVNVAVQKRANPVDTDMDPLIHLAEKIADLFRGAVLPDPVAHCVAVAIEPIYAPDHLEEFRQFTSVLTLTFRLWR